jgi:hypothetical protein
MTLKVYSSGYRLGRPSTTSVPRGVRLTSTPAGRNAQIPVIARLRERERPSILDGQLDSSSGEAGWLKRQTADSLMLASYDNLDKSQYGADWRSRRQAKLILLKHTELRRTALLADSSPICREVWLAKKCAIQTGQMNPSKCG